MIPSLNNWYLVSYDVRQRHRLAKLHRLLKKHGLALQESVFLLYAKPKDWPDMEQEIQFCIKRKEDDLRVYQLNQHCELIFLAPMHWQGPIHFAGYPPYRQCIALPRPLSTVVA